MRVRAPDRNVEGAQVQHQRERDVSAGHDVVLSR
jgi:hypothetical protein